MRCVGKLAAGRRSSKVGARTTGLSNQTKKSQISVATADRPVQTTTLSPFRAQRRSTAHRALRLAPSWPLHHTSRTANPSSRPALRSVWTPCRREMLKARIRRDTWMKPRRAIAIWTRPLRRNTCGQAIAPCRSLKLAAGPWLPNTRPVRTG